MKIEKDEVQLLSGVRHGLTLGSPVGLQIQNRDWSHWTERMSVEPPAEPVPPVTRVRPGHADGGRCAEVRSPGRPERA